MQKRIKLKQFRVGLDLNQAKMAEKCGISRDTYSLIESGKRAGTAEFWLRFKTVFKLSPSEVWAMQYEGKE